MNSKKSIKVALICLILSLANASTFAYAGDYGTPKEVITITDEETGEVTKYTLDDSDIQSEVITDDDGNTTVTTTYEFGQDSEIAPLTNSSSDDQLNGWKGIVKITYTITSTTACLEKVNARLQQASGSSEIKSASLSYGQDLGTNSKHGYEDLDGIYGINITTGYIPGKYGYGLGHKIGAILTANIDNKTLTVESSVTF